MAQVGAPSVGADKPEDAVAAVVNAAVTAIKEPPGTPAPDPRVAAAFALGWQMAELYRPDPPSRTPPASDNDLPGLGKLGESERAHIALRQVEIALAKLADPSTAGKRGTPDLSALRKCIDTPTDAATRMPAVRDLHVELLSSLTASDFRLGKAYGLGRSLADTCRNPVSAATLLAELKPHRVAKLRGWLDDLASALPPHAGHSVSFSFERWTERLYTKNPRKPKEAIDPEEQNERAEGALPALKRQGQLWRALLSGEKSGTDMLHTANYLDAASRLFVTTGRIAWRFSLRFLPLVIVSLGLFGGGLAYIIIEGTQTSFVAGASGILASLGITWKGAGSAIGAAGTKAELHLWGAEIDTAIADAITLLPPQPTKKALLPTRTEKARDYAGRRNLAGQVHQGLDVVVKPELLEPVLNPERLLAKVEDLQQQKRAGVNAQAAQDAQVPPGHLEQVAQGIQQEKDDPARVQRASSRSGAVASAPPPVVYLSRKPQVSQFMSVVTHCFEASLTSPPLDHLGHIKALDQLWQNIERLSEDLRDRFRKFGPCDIRFIEPKLAQLAASLTGRHQFSKNPPVVQLRSKAKLFLVGDWATGLPQARNVAARIAEQLAQVPPDVQAHVIHLGDTYYSGLEDECRRRFLDLWPVPPGSRAQSWTLAGNHDMYAGGHGYFDVLLADQRFAGQQRCSYFAIANDNWQIIGLDSSYKNPDEASLEEPQAKWLGELLANAPASRGTILLTHHQPFSAYENVDTPLPQSVEQAVVDRKLSAWFWGHEHRCTVYNPRDETGNYKDVAKYEAVIGHGGVPQMRAPLPPEERERDTEWEFDDYYQVGDEQWLVGGFAVLTLDGDKAEVQYYDEYGKERRAGGRGYPSEQAGIEDVRNEGDERAVIAPDEIPDM